MMQTLMVRPTAGQRFALAAADTLAMAGRNLRVMSRVPAILVFGTLQPVVFVLMFRYVFGGAIVVPNVDYVDYLLPGIFVQTMVFGGLGTMMALADDLRRGLLDRFRSLPMARSAFLLGRVVADLLRNFGVLVLLVVVGYLVGFRPSTGIPSVLAAMALLLCLSFALSWIFVFIALVSPNPEAAQAAAFPPLVVLVFASSAFVPVDTMPGWLQAWATHQPVSVVVDTVRGLLLGGPVLSNFMSSLAWIVGLPVALAPVAIRRYRLLSTDSDG